MTSVASLKLPSESENGASRNSWDIAFVKKYMLEEVVLTDTAEDQTQKYRCGILLLGTYL